MLKSKL